MTLSTVALTGNVLLPNGTSFTDGKLTFTLTATDTEGVQVLPVAPLVVQLTGTAIPDGILLWRNSAGGLDTSYRVDMSASFDRGAGMRVNRTWTLGYIQLGAAGSYDIGTLLAASLPPPPEPAPAYVTAWSRGFLSSTDAAAARSTMGLPIVTPDQFGANTVPGTTDMTAAILAAAAYVSGLGGGVVHGFGQTYAVSATMDVSTYKNVTYEGLRLSAIGSWAADLPIFKLFYGDYNHVVNVKFRDCHFEGNRKASGISIENSAKVSVLNCTSHGVPAYAVRTRTASTELLIDGCNFRQWDYNESGWAIEANRSAVLIDIQTPDNVVSNTVTAYCLKPIAILGWGSYHNLVSNSHFYNDGYTPAAGQAICMDLAAPGCSFSNIYVDNGILQIDGLYTLGGAGTSFSGVILYKGTGTNTNAVVFTNSGGSPSDLSALSLDGVIYEGFTDANAVAFSGSFAATLAYLGGIQSGGGTVPSNFPYRPFAGGSLQASNFILHDAADPTKKAAFGVSSIPTGTTRTFFWPNTGGNVCVDAFSNTISATWTFSAKPTISADNADLGTSTNTGTINLASGASLSGRTKTVNIGTGGAAGSTTTISIGPAAGTGTIAVGSGVTAFTIPDAAFTLQDQADASKQARFEAASIATATTRTYTLPDASGAILIDSLPVKCPVYTVAGLPSAASNSYTRAFVSDSSVALAGNSGSVVVGGGANKVPVWSDGASWRIG